MSEISDNDWIVNAISIQSLVITLWTVYVALAAAALALVTSERPKLRIPAVRLCAIAAYLAASGVNLWAMLNARTQHDLMVNLIKSPALAQLKYDLLKPHHWVYWVTHLSADLGVALMMWFLPQRTAAGQKVKS